MRYLSLLLVSSLLVIGCASDDSGALPPTERKTLNTEDALKNVPDDQKESVRKTIEENQAKYGGAGYDNAMKNQGKK